MLFDWDTFFAATLAAIGDRDLAYADAMEILREAKPRGLRPQLRSHRRTGKAPTAPNRPSAPSPFSVSTRNSTIAGCSADAFEPLLRWNRWWAEHRDINGYLVWGTDADNQPVNPDDHSAALCKPAQYRIRPR